MRYMGGAMPLGDVVPMTFHDLFTAWSILLLLTVMYAAARLLGDGGDE